MRGSRLALIAVIVTSLAALVIGAIILVEFSSRGSSFCDHQVVKEFPSPNQAQKALVVVENCGATTAFASSVYLTYPGRSVDFQNDYIFSVQGLNDIEVVWLDSSALKVRFKKAERINRQAVVWRRQRIEYEEQP
jgi:hypothetical protein